jgi:hypothetical protein
MMLLLIAAKSSALVKPTIGISSLPADARRHRCSFLCGKKSSARMPQSTMLGFVGLLCNSWTMGGLSRDVVRDLE